MQFIRQHMRRRQVAGIEIERAEKQCVEFGASESDGAGFDFGEAVGGQKAPEQSPVAQQCIDAFTDEPAVAGAAAAVFAEPGAEHPVGRFAAAEDGAEHCARGVARGFQKRVKFFLIEFQNESSFRD